jgi:TIR domain-containing protein/HEAT repeat protein
MENVPHRLRIFLCHSSGDKPAVQELYHRLRSAADYIAPWLDEEDLLPGQRWEVEIPKAVRESDVVIVCLSRHAINKKGYVQKEIKFALDAADEQPEGAIYLIPVGLEDCELPQRLKHLHCVNLQGSRGFEQLMRSLKVRAESLGITENPSSIKPASIDKETEPSPIIQLRQELLASYPGDREKAARQLGRLGPSASSAVPTLIKKLKDASGPVRDAAAWALREIGTKPALDALARYENE